MNLNMRLVLTLVLMLFVAASVACQTASGSDEPEPYQQEEFDDWMLALRRAEIVAAGSFPLSLLATRFVYSLVRFAVASIATGAIDLDYAPWFFAPPGAPQPTQLERLGIVGGALLFSGIIAWIDHAIISQERSVPE